MRALYSLYVVTWHSVMKVIILWASLRLRKVLQIEFLEEDIEEDLSK